MIATEEIRDPGGGWEALLVSCHRCDVLYWNRHQDIRWIGIGRLLMAMPGTSCFASTGKTCFFEITFHYCFCYNYCCNRWEIRLMCVSIDNTKLQLVSRLTNISMWLAWNLLFQPKYNFIRSLANGLIEWRHAISVYIYQFISGILIPLNCRPSNFVPSWD